MSGKKRLGDEERIEALFYTYRPHSTEVAAARNYERGRGERGNGGREGEEVAKRVRSSRGVKGGVKRGKNGRRREDARLCSV